MFSDLELSRAAHKILFITSDQRWVDIAMADVDMISIFLTKIPAILISISFTGSFFGLFIYFIIAIKVVSEVSVIP